MILVVNADDFGMTSGVNRGIIQAHQCGVVTSTSLMVRGAAAAEAAALARENPRLSVGLHVDLCEWVYRDEEWVLAYSVVSTDDSGAVAAELARQLHAFRDLMGCEPSHIDSHQHVHSKRPARTVIEAAARKLRVPLRHFQPGITYCGNFYGQSYKGFACHEAIRVESLLELIRGLPEGITELACHPSADANIDSTYREERVLELESLCDSRVLAALNEAGVKLKSFRDLPAEHLLCAKGRPAGTPGA